MDKNNLNKILNRLIEMSVEGGLTGTYDNSMVSINFKVTEKFELRADDEGQYCLWYVTENNASPGEFKFKVTDLKEVKHYAIGEFEPCTCCEVIRFTFNDGSLMDYFDDLR
ncbi:MAG: hypothetical protein PHF63_13010 [Herbinix sp.]|nr:hypothetical protein [Herbinix sp.]